jgi:hypothetical protein
LDEKQVNGNFFLPVLPVAQRLEALTIPTLCKQTIRYSRHHDGMDA